MSNPSDSNGSSLGKIFTIIVSVIAAISIMAAIIVAITSPLEQRVTTIESQQATSNAERKQAAIEISTLKEKFTEVETQFKWQRELVSEKEKGAGYLHDDIRKRLDYIEMKLYRK